ncbi:phage major capsid protein [Faecalibacterium sp. CLA-AA-H254]|uniref:phage major capsid family protein n=1 Tax=Faecalibacterium hominis (ex Afrizal et al. 2022) TaxID=2881265 RepID=UPI001D0E5E0E|nr:phage major capsid protein [Faecalibacterium hominis (ex Afrizal et al. 2022)]MCC2121748.1 phage major capsid protein [Faecalibacterium hominis (ex Afrizal et al. 2022)]
MVNFDYDCSGWATKANVRCYDGLVIAQDAFKECSGKVVPMVYNHDHANVDNVIGHCLLENRPGGVYCYAKFNDTDTGKTARQCVESGDLSAFSIFANGLKKVGRTVKHGFIREVSLVLAGCNPGALIDEVVKHSADEDYEGGEAFIYNEDGLSLTHGMDPEGNPLEDLTHSADSGDAVTDDEATQEEAKMADEKNEGKTLEQVYNSMTDEQKECCHALVGLALEEKEGGNNDDGEEDDTVKQNVFDKDTNATVLKHSIEEINNVVKTAKSHGTMKAAFEDAGMDSDELAHSIDNIDWLFPEDHLVDTTPRIIDKPDDWVSVVMGAVHHIPFSRFKSMFADLTEEDARAKGYFKGNFKKEEVFGLLRRSTSPTTVYKKQKLDRDDVIDITSFEVVVWLKQEMRLKLNRELALAYLLGDGRLAASEDKIDENCIRPVFNDADLFTIKVQCKTTGLTTVEDKYKALIKQILRSRKEYRGSGTPTLFTTEDALAEMLLLEDGIGRPLYADEAALARTLRVKNIVTIPEMEGRKGAKGGDLVCLIVNLADYTVGADKGGAVSMFDDFDIDFNAQKYLIETRCSGALTIPFSAMAVEWAA